MGWKLTGECKRCGWCCRNVSIVYARERDAVEWVLARGFNVSQETLECIEVQIPHVCAQFDGNNCKIQDKKPKGCKEYPAFLKDYPDGMDPNKSLGPGCGYGFVDLDKVCDGCGAKHEPGEGCEDAKIVKLGGKVFCDNHDGAPRE